MVREPRLDPLTAKLSTAELLDLERILRELRAKTYLPSAFYADAMYLAGQLHRELQERAVGERKQGIPADAHILAPGELEGD